MRVNGMPDATIVDVVTVDEGVYYALSGYGIIMIELVLASFILRVTCNHIPGFMLTMSKNVAQIYVAQWIVIDLLSPVLAIVSNIWVNILIALFVLLLSYYGGKLLKKTILVRV